HEITGKVFGKVFSYEFRKVVALTMGFADGETANGQAVKGEFAQNGGALFSEIAMAAALNNTKQRLRRIASGPQRPFGPTMREIHGRPGFGLNSRGGNALIESHHDVAADRFLHLDA